MSSSEKGLKVYSSESEVATAKLRTKVNRAIHPGSKRTPMRLIANMLNSRRLLLPEACLSWKKWSCSPDRIGQTEGRKRQMTLVLKKVSLSMKKKKKRPSMDHDEEREEAKARENKWVTILKLSFLST